MIKITPIASSSDGNCIVIDNGQSRLLLDCGIPWKKALQGLGYLLNNVAGCLLTHGHGDHSRGIKDIAKAGIDIYLSHGEADAMGCFSHRFHRLYPKVNTVVNGGWMVLGFPVVHDSAEPFGFVVSSGADRVLYLTDTAYSAYKIPGVTHLICECNHSRAILKAKHERGEIDSAHMRRVMASHMSLERVKDMIEENEWDRLHEIHLTHLSRENSDEALFKKEIQAIAGCPVYVAGE